MTTGAEAFLDHDLSALDPTQFRPLNWQAFPKTARINMRRPEPLTAALKARAAKRGIPCERPIREVLEREVSQA